MVLVMVIALVMVVEVVMMMPTVVVMVMAALPETTITGTSVKLEECLPEPLYNAQIGMIAMVGMTRSEQRPERMELTR